MKTEAVLTFNSDGTAEGLYTEAISLCALGRLSVQRAGTIEFDDAIQQWVVRDLVGGHLFHHASRQQCLDWEREFFNNHEETKP